MEEKKQIATPTTESERKNDFSLETIIAAAVQIPGIKVERAPFLRERFKEVDTETLIKIVELGPIEAGCEQRFLEKKANALIDERTFTSTGASFLAGLPGGLAMAATIPADIIQYYAIALRMAQELAYLYGEKDLWTGEQIDDERVRNQLILYCGVMFGASGAAAALRVMASALSKHVAKTLAQKALTKTFYYPIVKSIAKAFTVKMTKEVFAKGVGKAIPVIGGLLSGGLTFFTMRPMGQALAKSLEEAHFHYTEEEIEADWQVIIDTCEAIKKEETETDEIDHLNSDEVNDNAMKKDSVILQTVPKEYDETTLSAPTDPMDIALEKIAKAKKLLDSGAITEDEFATLKAHALSHL